jgi:hypothetical protein
MGFKLQLSVCPSFFLNDFLHVTILSNFSFSPFTLVACPHDLRNLLEITGVPYNWSHLDYLYKYHFKFLRVIFEIL